MYRLSTAASGGAVSHEKQLAQSLRKLVSFRGFEEVACLQPFIQLVSQAGLEEPAEQGIALVCGPPSCLMGCEQPCRLICSRLSGAVLALICLDTHVCIGTQPVTHSLDATVSFSLMSM